MSKKYTMDQFIKENIAVMFEDRTEQMRFLRECEARGLRWRNGRDATDWTPELDEVIAYDRWGDHYLGKSIPVNYLKDGWTIVWGGDIVTAPTTRKFRCTGYLRSERCFTIGKVYEMSPEGHITSDDGFTYTSHEWEGCNAVEWLKDYYSFEEVDEDAVDELPPTKYTITIECEGDVTTAKMTVDGKVVKEASAKRNPEDKFDFSTGAKVAFERLWEEEKPSGFRVGDVVKYVGEDCLGAKVNGKYGKIVYDGDRLQLVEFFADVNGHNGNGIVSGVTTKNGHGWWCRQGDLELVTGREVKRDADVGDVIKIVTEGETDGYYRNGDVFEVKSRAGWCGVGVDVGKRPNENMRCGCDPQLVFICDDEYVVIEKE